MATVPELKMGKRGKFTPASLREYFRAKISNLDGMYRERYAYGVLSEAIQSRSFTLVQLQAIDNGLALGMNEGVR